MSLDIQIYSFVFSFVFGIFFYIVLGLFSKFIYSKKLFIKIVSSFIFSIGLSLLYFYILLKINNGYLHLYFFLMILLGYIISHFFSVKFFKIL